MVALCSDIFIILQTFSSIINLAKVIFAPQPYAIIIDGTGSVSERRLEEHGPGELVQASLTLVSSKVEDGTRTVVLTRPVNSTSYSLPAQPGPLDIITAVGWPGEVWLLVSAMVCRWEVE